MKVKKLAVLFSLALCALWVSPVLAEGKVGVINLDKVLRESDPAKKSMKKLEKEFEKRGQDLEKVRQQAQKLQEDLDKNGATLGDALRKTRERELADASREFQRRKRELDEDLNQRRNEELQAIIDRANKAVRAIAEKEGFDVIFQEAAFFNPRVDITEKVIKALADQPAK
jgi:outer membrane protein